jgi:hypothetical protein
MSTEQPKLNIFKSYKIFYDPKTQTTKVYSYNPETQEFLLEKQWFSPRRFEE